ncbi:MAG: hypothetical protein ACPG8Q_01240 [Candidatus Poseidoniaceae archaeon]
MKDTKVGTIIGERHHPNESRVRSMRMLVETDVAGEFMRKPAEYAPLPKELVHSINDDGSVRLSKSMRELQRRWRNTVRIDEQLYAPDEMLDRAVLDNQGNEVGIITGLLKVKRTYKGFIVTLRIGVQQRFELGPTIRLPAHAIDSMRWCWVVPSNVPCSCLLTSRSTRWTPLNLSECLTVILLMTRQVGGLPKRG